MSEEETTNSTTSPGSAVEEAAAPESSPKARDSAASAASAASANTDGERTSRKTRVGLVVSDKMHKTIVVEVTRRVPHPRFKKIVKHSTKLYAHDEKEEAKEGDRVKLMECRPLSKKKRWRMIEVLAQ